MHTALQIISILAPKLFWTVTFRHRRLCAGRLGIADLMPGLLGTWTFMH